MPWWWGDYDSEQRAVAEAKLAAERANHRAQDEQRERMQATIDAQKAAHDNAYQEQVRQTQANSAAKIKDLEQDRQDMISKFEKSTEATANATRAERTAMMNDHDKKIKEKDAAIAKERKDQEDRAEKLRTEYEATRAKYEAQVAAEKDKRIEDGKAHGAAMNELHEKRLEDVRAAGERIGALERDKTNIAIQGMMLHGQTIANSYLTLQNISSTDALQRDSNNLKTKLEAMRIGVNRLEFQRGKLLDWTVETKIKASSGRLRSYFSAPVMDYSAQVILDSLKNDLNNLKSLIEICTSDISANSSFSRDRVEEAKRILTSALDMIRPFTDEIAKVRVATVNTPDAVSLSGIDKFLNELRDAIDKFPSMIDLSTQECLLQEMARLAIQNQETMAKLANNAIAFGVSSIPAIDNGTGTSSGSVQITNGNVF